MSTITKYFKKLAVSIITIALLSACGQDADKQTELSKNKAVPIAQTQYTQSLNSHISLENSSLPNLFKDASNVVWMSYVSQSGLKTSLWLSHWHGDEWAEPELVAEGENWFVNWADFPSVVKNAKGFVAHWLQKNGQGTYAYGVQYASRSLTGKWQEHGNLHADNSETEHGFVSLVDGSDGFHAVWLDGRNMTEAGHGHSPVSDKKFDANTVSGMTLRYAHIGEQGLVTQRTELDSLTCDCCQTATVLTEQGLVVAYRDRDVLSESSEIRDIKILRHTNSGWVAAKNTPIDNWDIQACPVNGPMLSAYENNVALAWFTAADNKPKVQVVFSTDNANTFSAPATIDVGRNLGRVAVDWLNAESVVLTWIATGDNKAHLQSRIVHKNGRLEDVHTIADMDMSRSSGFPRVKALSPSEVMYVWTQTGDKPSIHTKIYKIK